MSKRVPLRLHCLDSLPQIHPQVDRKAVPTVEGSQVEVVLAAIAKAGDRDKKMTENDPMPAAPNLNSFEPNPNAGSTPPSLPRQSPTNTAPPAPPPSGGSDKK